MKKFLLILTVILTASLSFAADYDIKWYCGSEFSKKEPVADDMKVQSAGQFYGMFENGETIVVNDGVEAAVSGPNGFNKSRKINQAFTNKTEPNGDVTRILQPGFYFCFSALPTFGQKDPGEYTAVIPAGAFTIDGTANEEFSVTFIVEDTRTYTPKADLAFEFMEPGTEPVDEVTWISFRISRKVDDKMAYSNLGVKAGAEATVKCPGTDEPKTYAVKTDSEVIAGYYGYKLVITDRKDDFKTPGKYTITVPEGTVLLGDYEKEGVYYTNVELTFTFEVKGATEPDPDEPGVAVENVVADRSVWSENGMLCINSEVDAQAVVYTVAGQTVRTLNLAAGVNTVELPEAMYVVKVGDSIVKIAVK